MSQYWLVASHLKGHDRRRASLGSGPLLVGRGSATEGGEPDRLLIDFDPMLSRRHFEAVLEGDVLKIRALDNRHPLYFRGQEVREFSLANGQHFTSGQTGFEFTLSDASLGHPTRSHTLVFNPAQLMDQDAQRCLQALLDLQPLMSSLDQPEALLTRALPLLAQIVPTASTLLVVSSFEEELRTLASQGSAGLQPSRTLVRQALTHQETTCYFWDPMNPNSLATLASDVRWAVAAPIWTDGPTRFVLYAVGSETALAANASGRAPGELDRAVLTFAAGMLSQHLRGRWSALQVEEERRQRALAQMLRDILETLSRSLNPEEVAQKLVDYLKRQIGFDRSRCYTHRPQEVAPRGLWAAFPENLDCQVFRASEEALGGVGLPNTGWVLALRIRGREGFLAMVLLHRAEAEFLPDEVQLGSSLALQAGVALENALMFQRLQTMAHTDALTGVSNRRHFMEQAQELVQEARSRGESLSVALLDIDHFKKFNDTHGHLVGDLVLQKVAQLARQQLPNLGRYGGEEFAAVEVGPGDRLLQRVERLRVGLEREGLRLEDQRLTITLSAGVAEARDASLEQLLSAADERLYEAKRLGRNQVVSS